MSSSSQSIIDRWSRNEIAAVVLLLLLAAFVRLWKLEADPPLRLSYSNDVYTDAALYTFYAREYVQTGQFNTSEDERFGIFLKSTVTPVAVVVFTLFGVGIWQSNLVGVLYAMGALFCFYLFVRRIAGVSASLWFLLLSALSYNLVFFGRQPFLEHAMAFWAFLALAIVTYCRRSWAFAIAGLFLGVAALFSKIHGLIFLFPFACFLVWRGLFDDPRLSRLSIRQIVSFAAGYSGAIALWFVVSYLPAPSRVVSFYFENTIELHGAPDGLKSIGDFIESLLTFGDDTNLFLRMVVIGLLGSVFLGAVAYQLSRRESYSKGLNFGNAGYLFLAVMMVSFYLSLMIWNYRPLRYQLILIYPFCAGAAILLARLWHGWVPPSEEKVPKLFWPVCTLIAVVPTFQLFAGSTKVVSVSWWIDIARIAAPLSALAIAVVAGLIVMAAKRHRIPSAPVFTRSLAILLTIGAIYGSAVGYIGWSGRATYTLRDVNRDVALNVGAGALVTGPCAQSMTLENNQPSLIHMFGTAHPDKEFFRTFPITHLLVDDGNIARLYEDYPEVMKYHEHICTYFVGEIKVRLINVAATTGDSTASRYVRTGLEKAIIAYRNQDTAVALREIERFTQTHPLNIAGNLLLFEMANAEGRFETAESALKKAVEFSPTSYVLNARLGRFYRDRSRALASSELHELATRYYEQAVHLAPTAKRTVDEFQRFKEENK